MNGIPTERARRISLELSNKFRNSDMDLNPACQGEFTQQGLALPIVRNIKGHEGRQTQVFGGHNH